MKLKSTKCAICGKKIEPDEYTNKYGESCDFLCSDKCLEEDKRRNPTKIAKKFKYRIELQEAIKGKCMALFSMPITDKEFNKFLKYKFEIQNNINKKK